MRIRDLLAAESIELNGSAAGKQDVLNKMVDLMAKSGKIRDVETYRKGVFAREEEGTTGIGEGIAIPHCKSDAVKAPGLAAMVVKDGVEFDALDGAPVNLLFLIAAPNTEDNVNRMASKFLRVCGKSSGCIRASISSRVSKSVSPIYPKRRSNPPGKWKRFIRMFHERQ